MDLSPVGVIDDVAIGDHSIGIYEKTAAARELIALEVVGFDGDGGGFDTANEIRERVLYLNPRRQAGHQK
jgi:hypothetical protein